VQNKRIVITGGPGTGKSSVIKDLESQGHFCLHEVSREITLEAQREGITQLFLEQPLLFSERLLQARIQQHEYAGEYKENPVFLDRGVPDVLAYMDYFKSNYPGKFIKACEDYRYDMVFLLPPWEDIYQTDNERYESFLQAQQIHEHLENIYKNFGYTPIEVPMLSIEERSLFILNHLDV
jgi:predicted ATPase